MIIQAEDFKELEECLKFVQLCVNKMKQAAKVLEYDYMELDPLTQKQLRATMGNMDRILFGLDETELEEEILVDSHWMD